MVVKKYKKAKGSKLILIDEDTDKLLQELRVGDESYNSILWRNLNGS